MSHRLLPLLLLLLAVPAGAQELAAVSRAMTVIDAAALRGRLFAERQIREDAATGSPRDASLRFLMLWAAPRDEQGWDGFRAMLDDFPSSPWPHLGMARIYAEWRLWDQFDRDLARALEKGSRNWIAVLLRAQAAEARQRPAEARRDYGAVLEADPQNAEAHAGLARLLLASGDAAGARREAEATLRLVPGQHGALEVLGRLAVAAGDAAGARRWYAQAVEAGPRDRESRVALARLLREAGDEAGAAAQWKEAVGLREDAGALREVAAAARKSNDPVGEAKALERLVQVAPGPVDGWRRLAELRLQARDDAGAEQALRKTLDREPGDVPARVSLARLYLSRGDAVGALRELRVAGEPATAERVQLEKRIHLDKVEGRDPQAVQRAVGRLVDRAYRERLKATPQLGGELRLRVTLDGAGKATQVDVVEDTVHDGLVRACAYWNLRDASYPKNLPGRLTFAYALRPGAAPE